MTGKCATRKIIIIQKQKTAKEGDIVVALVDNETTLKRFYLDKRKKRVRLHPENRDMPDILSKIATSKA